MSTSERYRVLLSRRAEKNLRSIFEYIAQDSPQNAGAMVARILDAVENL